MANITDRVVSAISYFTFGIFGIIWLVYIQVAKKPKTKFAIFNIYQSFFVSIVFAIFGIVYDLIYKAAMLIGFIGKFFVLFDLFFNRTPIYFGYTISGLIITILIGYLVLFSLLGKKPLVPYITSMIEERTGL